MINFDYQTPSTAIKNKPVPIHFRVRSEASVKDLTYLVEVITMNDQKHNV
jgi:hypothetical protein